VNQRSLFLITLRDPRGRMLQYGIVAGDIAAAEKEADRLAAENGAPEGTKRHTSQTLHEGVDSVLE
jgi:hypothetical protein